MKKDRLIQMLRILAAGGGVFGVHFRQKFGIDGSIGQVLDFGQYGLYMFFIISGYLACTWNGEETVKWIKKKIMRLLPVYYLVLCVYVIIHSFVLNNTPKDSMYIGWLRFFTGLNSLLPSDNIFWKSIHAVWYVSVVWIFYILFALIWKKLRKMNIWFWYIIFLVLYMISIWINQNDSLPTVNVFAFLQYFVLGIMAYKYEKHISIIAIPCIAIVVSLIYDNAWLNKNVIISTLFMLVIALGKNKWVEENKVIFMDKIDECTYALFLVHPLFMDFIVPWLQGFEINKKANILIFLILLTGTVIIVHFLYEVKMQEILKMMDKRKIT